MSASLGLTPAQHRILMEVRNAGSKVYNGRARRPIEALERHGLVHVQWDMRAQSKGGGIELVEVITVTPIYEEEATDG